jgi:hypothetical protein
MIFFLDLIGLFLARLVGVQTHGAAIVVWLQFALNTLKPCVYGLMGSLFS